MSSRRRMTTAAKALAGVLALAALAGCVGDEPDYAVIPDTLRDAEFRMAFEETESQFVRSILADGVIERAEVEEAVYRTHSCWAEAGIDATLNEDPDSGFFGLGLGPEFDLGDLGAEMECLDAWFGPIQHLYPEPVGNLALPQAEGDRLAAACLVRRGLAPVGFTGQMLDELMSAHAMTLGPDDPNPTFEDWEAHVEEVGHPIIPETGVDLWGEEAGVCLMNPFA